MELPTVRALARLQPVMAIRWHGARVGLPMLLVLAAMCMSSCALLSRVPADAAVDTTLDRWTSVGMACDPPTKDAVPNALFQWICRGDVGGVATTIAMDGDDAGVFMIVAQVDAAVPTERAAEAFAVLVAATPVFRKAGEPLARWLEAWDGSDSTTEIAGGRFSLLVDEQWITFSALPGPRLHV
jgi:hypothetical protein